jgi:subtilase family serine protease
MKKNRFILSLAILLSVGIFFSLPLHSQGTQPPRADLIVDSITFTPSNPFTTDAITFTVIVKNIGTADSVPSKLKLQVGGETTPPLYAIESLTPGQTRQWKRQETLSVAQNYGVTATADANNNVTESNEGNNIKSITLAVQQPHNADVAVANISISPTNPTVHDRITVTVALKNIGATTISHCKAIVKIEGQDDVAPYSYFNWRSGDVTNISRTVTFSAAGKFTVKAFVDSGKEVDETDEGNNLKIFVIRVRP